MLLKIARQVVKLIPESWGAVVTRALAARTQRPKVLAHEQAALQSAKRIGFGPDKKHVAWQWGAGPLVVFVHGWGGRAAQMAPMAANIAAKGFRVVAVDITGHGDSPETHTRWEYFFRDLKELSQTLNEPVFAYVGHSAGGLAMMAGRDLVGISAGRYVCICAPSYPFPPITAVRRILNPSEGIISRYKEYIAAQFHSTWEQLEHGSAYDGLGANLLLAYDNADKYISHTEGDYIRSLSPSSRLFKTDNHGHSKILSAPELWSVVADFLAPVEVATKRD